MRLFVKARPNAKIEKVSVEDTTHFTVSVKEPPREDRANAAIIRILAEHLAISMSRLKIISGHTSRNKIIEVS